jgi:hypothetical protein
MEFIDAFKLNKAPKETKEGMFSDYSVYLPEAYTEDYMIRSDKTNRLCRYLVELEDGSRESVYGYFGVRKSTKWPHKSFQKLLSAMSKDDRYSIYLSLCPVRFEKYDEGIDWLDETYKASYYSSAVKHFEYFAIYNCSQFLNEFTHRMWAGFEAQQKAEKA